MTIDGVIVLAACCAVCTPHDRVRAWMSSRRTNPNLQKADLDVRCEGERCSPGDARTGLKHAQNCPVEASPIHGSGSRHRADCGPLPTRCLVLAENCTECWLNVASADFPTADCPLHATALLAGFALAHPKRGILRISPLSGAFKLYVLAYIHGLDRPRLCH